MVEGRMTDEVLQSLFKQLKTSYLLQLLFSSGGTAAVFALAMFGFLYLMEERDRVRERQLELLNQQWERRLTLVEENAAATNAATGAWGRIINQHSVTLDTMVYDVKNVKLQIDTVVKLVTENTDKIQAVRTGSTPVTEELANRIRRIENALPVQWPVQ